MNLEELFNNELVRALIRELSQCTVEELQDIREDWGEKMRQQGVSKRIILLCGELTDLVIDKKMEKVVSSEL